jgi:hypothetical protein
MRERTVSSYLISHLQFFFISKFNLCAASWNLFTVRNYMLFCVEIGFLVGHLLVYIVAAWFFCLFTENNVIHPCWLLLNLINGRVLYKHFLYIKKLIPVVVWLTEGKSYFICALLDPFTLMSRVVSVILCLSKNPHVRLNFRFTVSLFTAIFNINVLIFALPQAFLENFNSRYYS